MKKFMAIILAIILGVMLVGCGPEEARTPTLSPEGVENIIMENTIEETILWENVQTQSWD